MLIFRKKTFVARVSKNEYEKRNNPSVVEQQIRDWFNRSYPVDEISIKEPIFVIDANGSSYYDYEVVVLKRF